MKIMLDCSPKKIMEYRIRYGHDFWQLRTPLTRYKLAGVPYGLDNGCFTKFDEKTWLKLIKEAIDNKQTSKCMFVTMPDVVGDARRTKELFNAYLYKVPELYQLPRCLVLQDGIGDVDIDWKYTASVFVGGSDKFKTSEEAFNACKVAKMLGKFVHVGRVNTASRAKDWLGIADSIDGSGISRYDHMLEDCLRVINFEHESLNQAELKI